MVGNVLVGQRPVGLIEAVRAWFVNTDVKVNPDLPNQIQPLALVTNLDSASMLCGIYKALKLAQNMTHQFVWVKEVFDKHATLFIESSLCSAILGWLGTRLQAMVRNQIEFVHSNRAVETLQLPTCLNDSKSICPLPFLHLTC